MNRAKVREAIIVDTGFYDEAILPLFDSLGWKAQRHIDPPEDATIIMKVYESQGSKVFVDPIIVGATVKAAQALYEFSAPDTNKRPPVWEDIKEHSPWPRDGVRSAAFARISTELADMGRSDLAEQVYNVLTHAQHTHCHVPDWRVPSEIPPSVRQEAEKIAKTEEREPAKDQFDFAAFRADPRESLLLAEYEAQALTVRAKDMVDVGKEDFEARGWVYRGEHYGDGSLVVQVVLDCCDGIVPRPIVADALRELNISVGEDLQETDLDHDLESEEDEESIPFDDIPPEQLSAEEVDRLIAINAAGLAKEAEEKEAAEEGKRPPASLVLAEGAKFGIEAELFGQSRRYDVRIEIGDNVISVDCDKQQLLGFFQDCASIRGDLKSLNTKQEEETKQDERTGSDNDITEQD